MAVTKVLITGATGYIGGSVLATLLTSINPKIRGISISALVRKQEQAAILKENGVNGIIFSGLDDTDFVRKVASDHDFVINTANAFHFRAAEAIILGLADRKKQTGKDVYLIHTSGTSSLGDFPITGSYTETRVLSDKDDIYTYLRHREDLEPYQQRTTDLVVFEKGEAASIKTYILMSPTIYGLGSGLFNRTSIQIDAIMRAARRDGFTSVIGSGAAEWDHVHVEDLVQLYELVLARLLDGDNLPSNKKGIYFNETGHHSWRYLSERISRDGNALGYLTSDEVREVSLKEWITRSRKALSPRTVELGFASRSRTRADLARELGWKPTKTEKDFKDSFMDEWKVIAKEG
ncbi:NAD dependent epimerase/dehydratase family protein [Talaromyces stipitatus ATCC 10500]|uniref:NAD dependent epimerase/dehydratase family protein n=1 Tax=Talaromyces stipitatus (strain ATCC 10500 / CBS 375.48 / QM 6759 / NRRL 1006) TaxID=441959 RepID=B8MM28_TALSN|nr:NAD dependent epimerase/dehydratase family protein [Talaromyces stipitatus ATCC 10500]EED13540.1 NAD dependent epimerase/dehydratase family protein [Talaromyces stipitatus ATCC 10500]